MTQNISIGILGLLDSGNYQTYNRQVARKLKSVNAAILLAELINRYKYHLEENELFTFEKYPGQWFYYTIEKCTKRTVLSEKEQRSAFKILQDLQLFDKQQIGIPARRHFRLNIKNIELFILDSNNSSITAKRADLGRTKGQTYTYKEPYKEPQEEQQQEASPKVVVFPCFEKLEISDFLKIKLSERMKEEDAELAVCRVLRWKGRNSDAAALQTVIKEADIWDDSPSTEEKVEINRKFLDKLRKLDGKDVGKAKIIVGYDYISFCFTSNHKDFSIKEKDFIKDVEEYMEKSKKLK
jgi:hypothetical protein